MHREKKEIIINYEEHLLLVRGLNDLRIDQLKNSRPADDIENLLLKIMNMTVSKGKRRICLEE